MGESVEGFASVAGDAPFGEDRRFLNLRENAARALRSGAGSVGGHGDPLSIDRVCCGGTSLSERNSGEAR